MSEPTELLPCPFCGGEAHLVSDYSSERDETRWNLWHECDGHKGKSNGYGYSLHPWFETPWYKTEAEAIAAWNARAAKPCYATDYTHEHCKYSVNRGWVENVAHGTLTADQVRYSIEKRFGIDVWVPFARWQAIADELNAELVSGTCEDLGGIGANGKEVFHCSKCGCILSLFDSDGMNTLCTSFICDYPRFCPECGRKVVSA